MMRSASRQALVTLQQERDAAVNGRESAAALTTIARELYAIADVLVENPRLRRALADVASAPEARVSLLEAVFAGKVGEHALKVASAAVALRWSSPWDLTDSLEATGDDSLFAAAEKNRELDQVEDELFRFERILQGDGEVIGLLDEQNIEAARRNAFLDALVGGKVSDPTLELLHHAVASDRKRSILLAIDNLLEQAAERQDRSIARVVSASPLSDEQQQRLSATLGEMYGRAISLRMALDPSLRGGVVIRIGDEVIDGSVAARLVEARSALAG